MDRRTLWFAGPSGVLASLLQKLAVVPWQVKKNSLLLSESFPTAGGGDGARAYRTTAQHTRLHEASASLPNHCVHIRSCVCSHARHGLFLRYLVAWATLGIPRSVWHDRGTLRFPGDSTSHAVTDSSHLDTHPSSRSTCCLSHSTRASCDHVDMYHAHHGM